MSHFHFKKKKYLIDLHLLRRRKEQVMMTLVTGKSILTLRSYLKKKLRKCSNLSATVSTSMTRRQLTGRNPNLFRIKSRQFSQLIKLNFQRVPCVMRILLLIKITTSNLLQNCIKKLTLIANITSSRKNSLDSF